MLIRNNQLTLPQLEALDQLAALCRTEDKGLPAIYRHLLVQKRATDSNLLYFDRGKLVAFLSVYFFYETAVEVTILVAPSHRKLGLAAFLLKTIQALLLTHEMKSLIFSSPSVNASWLSERGFTYLHSQYIMERDGTETAPIFNTTLTVRKANLEDLSTLSTIDTVCFPKNTPYSISHLTNLITDNTYTILVALYQDTIVGYAHLRWLEKAYMSDICILPAYRNLGLGKVFTAHCINLGLTREYSLFSLDVESKNQHAINIYLDLGFNIVNTNDFWSISMDTMNHYL